jgi:hypothetical protein
MVGEVWRGRGGPAPAWPRAGVPRNLTMLNQHADSLLAFQIGWSPGTQRTNAPIRRRNTPRSGCTDCH